MNFHEHVSGADIAGDLMLLAAAAALSIVAAAVRVRVRIRRPRIPISLLGGLSCLGFALVFSTPAAAGSRRPSPLPRREPVATQPWSGAVGSSPHRAAPAEANPITTVHRAIHPGLPAGHLGRPLFPRAGNCEAEKRECMRRHPAGKALGLSDSLPTDSGEHHQSFRRHRVRAGESLWSIAAAVLDRPSSSEIARYWPKIHRLNRETIGADPNLLFPGQVLQLPEIDR
jgi:nucleoid-associated protein YgaU